MWLHEIGVQYSKARMYAPHLGRFPQPDPIGYADGMNKYAYVGNDPVNLVDPLGLEVTGAPIEVVKMLDDITGNVAALLSGGASISGFAGPYYDGGGGGEPEGTDDDDQDQCPVPSNVSLTGTISVVPAGPARFSGKLVDVASGRSYSVSAFGFGGGAVVGQYELTATVTGFNALRNGLDIGFTELPFGAGGARLSDNSGRPIGTGTVNASLSPSSIFGLSAGAVSFDPPSVTLEDSGTC